MADFPRRNGSYAAQDYSDLRLIINFRTAACPDLRQSPADGLQPADGKATQTEIRELNLAIGRLADGQAEIPPCLRVTAG
jgi:hypothetical protein